MAFKINEKIIFRAFDALVQKKSVSAFSRSVKEYDRQRKSEPMSQYQLFINRLLRFFDPDIDIRTEMEIDYQTNKLATGFMNIAETILTATPLADGSYRIPIRIGNNMIELVCGSGNKSKIYFRGGWFQECMSDLDLPNLRRVLLEQYINHKREDTERSVYQIDLTGFYLNGLDLTKMNFKNCRLPDLMECTLTGIEIDQDTLFQKRIMCWFDDDTFDRLQMHKWETELTSDSRWQNEPGGNSNVLLPYHPRPKKISEYRFDEIFGSENHDLACKKRHLLSRQKKNDGICHALKNMVVRRQTIYLSHVNLSMLDLSGLDLSFANMDYAKIDGAKLSNVRMDETKMRHTSFVGTTWDGAYFENLHLRVADRKKILILCNKQICAIKVKENGSDLLISSRRYH